MMSLSNRLDDRDDYVDPAEYCRHGVDTEVECWDCEDEDLAEHHAECVALAEGIARSRAEALYGVAYADELELETLYADLQAAGVDGLQDEAEAVYLEVRLAVGAAPEVRGAA